MLEEIYIAGFGGQGALSTGQLLAHAGLKEGRNVSYVPFYGVEKRGGVANCGVTISDREISCPIVTEPTVLIAMNSPSLERFESTVVPGGLIITNSSLVDVQVKRDDVRVVQVRANEEAESLGDAMVANNIILGVLLELTGVVSIKAVEESLKEVLPARHHVKIPLNVKALERGAELAREYKKSGLG
ncbi:MAG: 2-oxoacid:acceptor oxidoreductase family protein [Pelotomaculum sp.]|uniref:Pyruvate:ferredoxin oxidoreductase and related 2-oxoacid:ferredoxin oxidoreductases, gamma subunit n=1 Tax=Pelotomaculum thermopropionicum (strain DSM 13744 / JCM 10971 / SI) TaxID=370438 RepID=A5D307_PELTS|nr:2-oxoacid:acceptor oxidoreductase family protein [Pelotomaculum sp.]BAF59388.1 pyruvate:ferredoxin oxidoreductase and related 2-oxoacid:ferredoxin oxidoreductases, gamma subunit [Pelotomaculum thermopropionicum SI]